MRWRKVGEATAEEGSRYQVHRSLSYGEEVPEFRPGAQRSVVLWVITENN